MKKKIIISIYDDLKNPIYAGGGARAVNVLATSLTSKYDVEVLTGTYAGAKNEIINGVSYRRIGSDFFGQKIGQLIYQALLPFQVLARTYDVWIESFTPPFSTAFLQLFTKKPVIGLVHMLAATDMERKYKLPFHHVENKGLQTYRNFIVLSEASKKYIQKINPKANFLIVPNGVIMPKNSKSYQQRPTSYLLFMGRLEVDQKGIDVLLKAFSLVLKQFPTVKLKIAGTGSTDEIHTIKTSILDNNLSNNVVMLGRVTGEIKAKTMKGASIMLIPSRYETFSLVALEALSYGIPIVCFDIPGMSWLNEKVTMKANAFSAKSFASKIIRLIKDEEVRNKIAEYSVREAEKYDWHLILKKYEAYIEKLL